jgi:hypothetical protein
LGRYWMQTNKNSFNQMLDIFFVTSHRTSRVTDSLLYDPQEVLELVFN